MLKNFKLILIISVFGQISQIQTSQTDPFRTLEEDLKAYKEAAKINKEKSLDFPFCYPTQQDIAEWEKNDNEEEEEEGTREDFPKKLPNAQNDKLLNLFKILKQYSDSKDLQKSQSTEEHSSQIDKTVPQKEEVNTDSLYTKTDKFKHQHICPYTECGKEFPSKSKLERHLVCHTKQKPYECSKCGNTYSQRDSTLGHIGRKHPGEKVKVIKRKANEIEEEENQ